MDLNNLNLPADRQNELQKLLDAAHKNYMENLENLTDAATSDMEELLARDPTLAHDLVDEYTQAASQLSNDYYDVQRELWSEYAGVNLPDFDHTTLVDTDRVLWQQQGGFNNTDFNGLTYQQVKAGQARSGMTVNDLWPDLRNVDTAQQFIADMITTSTRLTTQRNMRTDPTKPRYARVPKGSVTCAFCTMLASRGFAYLSEERAGLGNSYHHRCDCAIVPSWGKRGLSGYDPGAFRSLWDEAARETDGTDYRDILKTMRRQNPALLKDGVSSEDLYNLEDGWLKELAANGPTASNLNNIRGKFKKIKPVQLNDGQDFMGIARARFAKTQDSSTFESDLDQSFASLKLSESELKTIKDFTADSDPMNKYLRNQGDFSYKKNMKEVTLELREALGKSRQPHDMFVYRSEVLSNPAEGDAIMKSALEGKPYIKPNFTSTTTRTSALDLEKNPSDLFVIRIPQGSRGGAYINSASAFKNDEFEFLINAGSAYRITDIIERKNKRPVFIMELLE